MDAIDGPTASHLVVEKQSSAPLERRPRCRISEQRQILFAVSQGQMRIVRTFLILEPSPCGRDDQRRTSLAEHRGQHIVWRIGVEEEMVASQPPFHIRGKGLKHQASAHCAPFAPF